MHTNELKTIKTIEVKNIQHKLNCLGGNLVIDGIIGPKTLKTWDKFKTVYSLNSNLNLISQESQDLLINKIKLTGLKESELRVVSKCLHLGLSIDRQIAYVLATVKHETNDTFRPVKEAYWLSETWRKNNLTYFPYYGRGFIQLTHKYNYQRYENILNIPLVTTPDLALEFETSLFICIHGMKHGVFTGHRLETYVNKTVTNYISARKVVNGIDKAALIASYARHYTKYLFPSLCPLSEIHVYNSL